MPKPTLYLGAHRDVRYVQGVLKESLNTPYAYYTIVPQAVKAIFFYLLCALRHSSYSARASSVSG